MTELADRVRAARPDALVIAETALGDRRPIEAVGGRRGVGRRGSTTRCTSSLTGERDGYYGPYGQVSDLARAFAARPADRLVVCAQNHDQVGNRACGDRLPPAVRRIAAACVLFAPQIPLLFMGEEYGETSPFQFFTDHDDPRIAAAVTGGTTSGVRGRCGLRRGRRPRTHRPRRRSSARGSSRSSPDRELSRLYAELLRLRRTLPRETTTAVDEERRILRVRRGGVELVLDFERLTAEVVR